VSGWIDISAAIHAGMTVWKGDPPITLEQLTFLEKGDLYNASRIACSVHTGTHMDAPRHFLSGGAAMDAMPLEATLGPCVVAGIEDPVCVRPEELEPLDLESGARLLLRTRNSTERPLDGEFDENFVYVSAAAARWMVEKRVRTVGIDYLSVGGFTQDLVETHEILLGAGVWVIEGLRLGHVEPGRYELACLPLKIAGCDGAPARAALRKL
jgi:arylformamidase